MAVKVKVKIELKDRGMDKIKRSLKQLNGGFVLVGVHKGAGKYTGAGKNPTVAQVAFWNEFGTKTNPERPALRSTVFVNKVKLKAIKGRIYNRIVSGSTTVKKGLDSLGFTTQAMIQTRIDTSAQWAIPNAPSTARSKQKGGALRGPTPLIMSGLYKRSITFKTKLARSV